MTKTYVGNIDVVLGHVQADGYVCEVENGANGVAVEDKTLNQTNEGERHVCRRENISGHIVESCHLQGASDYEDSQKHNGDRGKDVESVPTLLVDGIH